MVIVGDRQAIDAWETTVLYKTKVVENYFNLFYLFSGFTMVSFGNQVIILFSCHQ
jgi:hypothetical protein